MKSLILTSRRGLDSPGAHELDAELREQLVLVDPALALGREVLVAQAGAGEEEQRVVVAAGLQIELLAVVHGDELDVLLVAADAEAEAEGVDLRGDVGDGHDCTAVLR